MIDLLRQFVRGEITSHELVHAGVIHKKVHSGWVFHHTGVTPFVVTAQDVICGLQAWRNVPSKRKEWASLLLSAADLFSFEVLEATPEGESLIEQLWDFSKEYKKWV